MRFSNGSGAAAAGSCSKWIVTGVVAVLTLMLFVPLMLLIGQLSVSRTALKPTPVNNHRVTGESQPRISQTVDEESSASHAEVLPLDSADQDSNAAQWVPMFNDHDLTGWEAVHAGTIDWTNENGTITGRNRSNEVNSAGTLLTKTEYQNFHFRCEVLAGSSDGGSISFRNNGSRIKGARRGYVVLNPAANSPLTAEGWGVGSLYVDDFQVPLENSRLANAKETGVGIHEGDWYVLEILAQDEAIEVRINGKKTIKFVSKDPVLAEAGAFCLRCPQGATVTYRNLEVKFFRSVR